MDISVSCYREISGLCLLYTGKLFQLDGHCSHLFLRFEPNPQHNLSEQLLKVGGKI